MTAHAGQDGPLVALVTGARVGIGLATAVALSGAGLRVAITSRSGLSGRQGPPAGEGTLEQAVTEVEEAGGEVMAVGLDLSDRARIADAVDQICTRWGAIDILVNNALCEQPGAQERLATADYESFARMLVGEVVNTAYLTARVLERARERTVTVVNVGSAAADYVPPAPVDQGGYAYSYAASKAALHRLSPFLQLEYGQRVRAFTVNPGVVRTERLLERLGDLPGSVPPTVPAEVIRWLALDPEADTQVGAYLHAQKVAQEKGWVG